MQLLLVWSIHTLTLIDHCNIRLSIITPMLQHTCMVFDQSGQCKINCTMSEIGHLRNT